MRIILIIIAVALTGCDDFDAPSNADDSKYEYGVTSRAITNDCTAEGSSLSQAKLNFADNCPTFPRKDCDPIASGWLCSSDKIGDEAPSVSVPPVEVSDDPPPVEDPAPTPVEDPAPTPVEVSDDPPPPVEVSDPNLPVVNDEPPPPVDSAPSTIEQPVSVSDITHDHDPIMTVPEVEEIVRRMTADMVTALEVHNQIQLALIDTVTTASVSSQITQQVTTECADKATKAEVADKVTEEEVSEQIMKALVDVGICPAGTSLTGE